jgi:tRNA pseudouridine55 synthase
MPAPAYSAVKHKGVPLYKYARRGAAVPVKLRSCVVHEWKAVAYQNGELAFRLSCSSGTYVRSLAESLGRRLGCGAAVSALRRESVAGFTLAGALTLEDLKGLSAAQLAGRIEAGLALLAKAAA